jgi:hypothetical protein
VVALYGHAGGLVELFERLGAASPDAAPPLDLLRSHPLTADRLEVVRADARARGWALDGRRTPLVPPLSLPAPPAAAGSVRSSAG